MNFNEKYTTKEKKEADHAKEAQKAEISSDAFALGELLEKLNQSLDLLRRK
jgi:hypothetical protein